MKAELIHKRRVELSDTRFVEMVIWQVPQPVRGSTHGYKYRLVLVANEVCVLRYDNEAGKGDHKHVGAVQVPYTFTTLDQLMADFWNDESNL